MRGLITVVTVFVFSAFTSTYLSAQAIVRSLEKGEVMSSRMGESFYLQTLVDQELSKIMAAFEKNDSLIERLNFLFPNIGFTKAFVTKDGRNLLYLKIKDLAGGAGIFVELTAPKNFDGTSVLTPVFDKAAKLPDGVVQLPANNAIGSLESPWAIQLGQDVSKLNSETDYRRSLSGMKRIQIMGPLNHVPALEGVSFKINIALSEYEVKEGEDFNSPTVFDQTFVFTHVAMGRRPIKEDWGRFTNFGAKEIRLAEYSGTNLMRALQKRISHEIN